MNFVTRKAGATWVIPTEDEWYKAAYHQPAAQGGDSDDYWLYPTRSNTQPSSVAPPGSSAPTPSSTANFLGDDAKYAVTGSATISSSQNYLTDRGAYTLASSFYGTFDQGGNVFEWNEALTDDMRDLRGDSWGSGGGALASSFRLDFDPTHEDSQFGFRVAEVPEPASLVLAALGFLGIAAWPRKNRQCASQP